MEVEGVGARLIVVGGGIVGVATARELVLRGHSVMLIEKDGLGGAVTGASLACINTHMSNRGEIEILKWASGEWAALDARLGHAMEYRRCGQLRFLETDDDRSVAKDWIAFEASAGVESRLLEPVEVRTVEPLLSGPIKGATYAPDVATVTPFLAVRMLVRDAVARGLKLRLHTPVRRIDVESGKARAIVTDSDRIAADAIILAAGPWTRALAATAGLDVPIMPRRAQCLASVSISPSIRGVIAACEPHGGVAAGYTQIQQAPSGQVLFNTVLPGGLADEGAQDHVPEVDLAFVRNSIRQLLWLFPSFSGLHLLRSWVRYEAVTPDDRFLAGPTPIGNLHLAAGDGGSGFARSLAVGRVIADRLDGRQPPFDAQLWSPGRFPLAQAA
jgi:D-hydroxyproline dehydrogenase subunit beta